MCTLFLKALAVLKKDNKCIFPSQGSSWRLPSFSMSPVNCIACHVLDKSIITVTLDARERLLSATAGAFLFSLPRRQSKPSGSWHEALIQSDNCSYFSTSF